MRDDPRITPMGHKVVVAVLGLLAGGLVILALHTATQSQIEPGQYTFRVGKLSIPLHQKLRGCERMGAETRELRCDVRDANAVSCVTHCRTWQHAGQKVSK